MRLRSRPHCAKLQNAESRRWIYSLIPEGRGGSGGNPSESLKREPSYGRGEYGSRAFCSSEGWRARGEQYGNIKRQKKNKRRDKWSVLRSEQASLNRLSSAGCPARIRGSLRHRRKGMMGGWWDARRIAGWTADAVERRARRRIESRECIGFDSY